MFWNLLSDFLSTGFLCTDLDLLFIGLMDFGLDFDFEFDFSLIILGGLANYLPVLGLGGGDFTLLNFATFSDPILLSFL